MSEVERRLDGLTEEQKRELLLRLLAEQAGADGAPAGDDAASASATAGGTGVAGAVSAAGESGAGGEVERRAPLSYAQQRLWFLDQLEGGRSALYNIPMTLRLVGELDAAALGRAFAEVVRRHEALRTTFEVGAAGRPEQVVRRFAGFRLEVRDLSALGREEAERQAGEEARREAARPFDLREGPLARATLLRLGAGEHVLCVALHHIVSDGWSTGVLVRELAALYGAYVRGGESPLAELPVQYADYARRQREWLEGEELERQLSYWRGQLGDRPTILELPTDRPRSLAPNSSGGRVWFSFPPALTQSLRELSEREGATLFMTLLAGFQVMLSRYTGQEEIIVGSPIANRHRMETEALIGCFINMLALRTDVSGDPSFKELLGRVRETALGAYAHQDMPFEYLVEQLQPERELNHNPLVQVVFVLQNNAGRLPGLPGLSVTPLKEETDTAKFDLTLYVNDTGDELEGAFEYSAELFDRETVSRMSGHLLTLLEGVVADPAGRISNLSLLTPAERRRMLYEWNDTREEYPRDLCAHQLFEAQVERTPDAVALATEGEQLSYRQLNARANRLARRLQALGVGPGELVGVFMERSVEMIVGVLGILKSGAACLPLDPKYPGERLSFMLEDARAKVVLTQERLAATRPESDARVVCVDAEEDSAAEGVDENPRPPLTPENLVYVIYTSGSTGRPKGVAMPHRALVNLAEWHRRAPAQSTRTLQFASLNFDVSFQEMFSTWTAGGTLLVIREQARADIPALGQFLERNGVERFHLPVIVLQKLSEEFCQRPGSLPGLRELMVGGEQLQITAPVVKLFSRLKGCALYNHYGPSETHVITSYRLAGDPESWPALPPLGRPISNTVLYVLDARLQPVPAGVPGELYIGGECLAHGYLRRPALTAERFVPNPFSLEPGARIYKTGDVARYLAGGDVEYLGRNDFQVKIRGIRIELGEIEVALRRRPEVREAAVTVWRDGPAGESRLVAYVVASPDRRVSARELRESLSLSLPSHMIPATFVTLDAMPQTPSGKINRLALPPPAGDGLGADEGGRPPANAVERALAAIFAEVLSAEHVGPDDDFFSLGGHSLLGTQITSRVRDTFRVELPLRKFFESPTVAGVAAAILKDAADPEGIELTAETSLSAAAAGAAGEGGAGGESLPASAGAGAVPRPTETRLAPLSFAQQRLWFLDQYEPESVLYNIPAALRLTGPLDVAALERSVRELVRRHETLRTTFAVFNGRPFQVIHEPTEWRLHVRDLRRLPPETREAEVARLADAEAQTPFNLARGPLSRVGLLRLAEDEHVLLLTMHHIISDGWSLQILVGELGALYDAYRAGRESPLAELPMQYAEFARWQRDWLQGEVLEGQLGYWKRQLAGKLPALELPTDRPRPAFQTYRGGELTMALPRRLSEQVAALGRREGATVFMTLLAAFGALLHRYTGQTDVCVGTPIAGRNRSEIEGLIGFFVNTLVLRLDLSRGESFRRLLGETKGVALDAYDHQDLPFEKLLEELQPERDLGHSPLFQVMFHMQNVLTEAPRLSDLMVAPLEIRSTVSRFDLTLVMAEGAEGLVGKFSYNADLFEAATVGRMAVHFRNLLEAAVADPEAPISRLPLLADDEARRMLVEWNQTLRPYPSERPLHEWFEEQAARAPEATALVFEDERVSYRELDERANQLARHLRGAGVSADSLVGVLMERSTELVVALLGTLKAGAAYVPLDPSYPPQRLAFMLGDAGVSYLLTHKSLLDLVPEPGAPALRLDADWPLVAVHDRGRVGVFAGPEQLAYVIYTSGSTGAPKGVMVSHRAICNRLLWMQEAFQLTPDDRVLQKTPFSFDVSVWEFFWPLMTGATLVLARPGGHQESDYLARLVGEQQITTMHFVPSMLQVFLEGARAVDWAGVKRVICSGEALGAGLARRFAERAGRVELWNLYGPTEAAVDVTYWRCTAHAEVVPIGRPIANVQTYILDDRLRPVPAGVRGELYLGGVALARGYRGRAGLTAERFIPNPFSGEPGSRLYRTGDVARYLADGDIEYLGRADEQVKLRGFRIELGEVEAALTQQESVRECVVVARGEAGERRLVAYVVAREGRAAKAGPLSRALRERLPEYMLPSAYVFLDELPLTPNGKVDRRALPEPDGSRGEQETPYVAPRDATEESLAEIFREVLEAGRVGIDDNFFELGGHSLSATQVAVRVHQAFGRELPVRKLFELPTVRGLAEFLNAHDGAAVSPEGGGPAAG
jgi:amino acid adenylation domain-containing protein